MKIIVDSTSSNKRLDHLLTEELTNLSRNKIKNHIDDGLILVNGQKVKAGYKLNNGDVITLDIKEEANKYDHLQKVNLNLEIIYEDDDLLVLNKPKNLVVHPAASFQGVTLVNGLLYQVEQLSTINGESRPGIIHRLDKDTEGLMIVAKSNLAHQRLAKDLTNRKIIKKYLAICYGTFSESSATINMPIARDPKNRLKMTTIKEGRPAITHLKVLKQLRAHTLVELDLVTGRTHQIRVHLKAIGHPILGDETYGPKNVYGKNGQYLQAYYLAFKHPITKKALQFELKMPVEFEQALKDLA